MGHVYGVTDFGLFAELVRGNEETVGAVLDRMFSKGGCVHKENGWESEVLDEYVATFGPIVQLGSQPFWFDFVRYFPIPVALLGEGVGRPDPRSVFAKLFAACSIVDARIERAAEQGTLTLQFRDY